jgi:hypothetical protein
MAGFKVTPEVMAQTVLFLPFPYRLMGELKSSEKKHLGQIAQTELVSQSAQHHLEDNVG